MYCRNCGKEMDPEAAFCSACGCAVSGDEAPVNKQQAVNYQILVKSSSCKSKLDEWYKNLVKILGLINLLIGAPGIIYIVVDFFMYINNKAWKMPYIPVWVYILYFAVDVFVLFFYFRKQKSLNEEYARFNGYCSTENLLVDTEKIYGSTTRGQLSLKYDQISRVTLRKAYTTTQTVGEAIRDVTFLNDTLEITDTANHRYNFKSFDNCRELRAIIEDQMKSGVNQ